MVSGGFQIVDADAGNAVAAGLDESHPVGGKEWHVGLWEHPAFELPAGGQLQAYAYCKKTPKPKKRKKR